MVRWPWLTLIALAGVGLVSLALFLAWPAPRSCQPRTDDPQGYLYKICRYVQEKNLDVLPGDSTRYGIKRLEERTENGRPVIWVFLDCCYMGDIAIIDPATGEVIDFRLGAK